MWRSIFLATLALLLSATMAVNASPIFLRVIDQYGQTVSNQVKVTVLGGEARLYNATHWLVEVSEASAPVRVELYNVTVWQGTLEVGKSYVVKASVVEMLVETPDPGLVVEVELAGSSKRWRLVGEKGYRLYPVPVGTYIIRAHGAVDIEKTIYFTGGKVKISPDIDYSPTLLPLLITATLPTIGYMGYRAAKRRRSIVNKKAKAEKRRRPRERPGKYGGKKKREAKGKAEKAEKIDVMGKDSINLFKKKDRTLADILDSLPE